MSKEAVAKVVQRAISDGAFRRQLSTDPNKALRGFDLSPAETAAIRSGDSGRLTAFGVDLRMSKAFTLAGMDSGSQVVTSDLAGGESAALTSSDGAAGSGALIAGDGATGSSALTSGGGAMGDNALISGDTSDSQAMIASGNETGHTGIVIPGDPAHAYEVLTGPDGGTAQPDDVDQYAPQFHSAFATDEGQITGAVTGAATGAVTGAVTGSDGGTALPDEADQYAPQFHSATQEVVSDDGGSVASLPTDSDGSPEIQP